MITKTVYNTRGVCSRQIHIELDGDKIVSVNFVGGCSGNTQGVARLAEGRTVEEVLPLIRGISCGGKPTSCPDQLSIALEEALKKAQEQ